MFACHSVLGLGQGSSYALFDHVVQTQAVMLELNNVFYGATLVMIAIITRIWITKPSKVNGSGGTAAATH
jgi:MFS transporter, DHA2 family, multidrug resistance protein